MAISFVGEANGSQSSAVSVGTDLTLSLPAHQADDFAVIAAICRDTGTDPVITVNTAGWTERRTDNSTPGADRQTSIWYRKFSSASETDPAIGFTQQNDRCASVTIWRGVSGTTTFDVDDTSDLTQGGASSTEDPTNPAITTSTDNAFVLLVAAASQGNGLAFGAPTNYDLRSNNTDQNDAVVAVASREIATGGPETPGAWVNSGATSTPDWSLYTLALRQAAADITIQVPLGPER